MIKSIKSDYGASFDVARESQETLTREIETSAWKCMESQFRAKEVGCFSVFLRRFFEFVEKEAIYD